MCWDLRMLATRSMTLPLPISSLHNSLCSLAGRELELTFSAGSLVAEIYGTASAIEHYYCNFGVNPDYVPRFKNGPLKITGSDSGGEIRVIELPGHPFFVGTLFVPQARSTMDQPHPLVTAFMKAVQENRSLVPAG